MPRRTAELHGRKRQITDENSQCIQRTQQSTDVYAMHEVILFFTDSFGLRFVLTCVLFAEARLNRAAVKRNATVRRYRRAHLHRQADSLGQAFMLFSPGFCLSYMAQSVPNIFAEEQHVPAKCCSRW
ncbi:Uncharacterized protein DAT39_006742 [Clarias magur]|uniref:Uncharacterized protein n=1 Tax=Clarias magur TaxID=1594786 RepID=A0A8J4U0R0_CLAMG|nr:Uncharacterized protein DAT39_006742 [Clarias magur]